MNLFTAAWCFPKAACPQRHGWAPVVGGNDPRHPAPVPAEPSFRIGRALHVAGGRMGTRPEFQIVTGISTGALMAPFAFLGPDYDPVLRQIYTEFSTKDLVELRGPLQIIDGDAVMSTRPLRRKIAEYIDADVIARIAAEGRKGRSPSTRTT